MSDMIDKTLGKIREGFGGKLTSANLMFMAASIGEDYLKRVLESKYDQLAETALFKRLKSMDDRQRLVLEFAMYFLNTIPKRMLSDNTPLSLLVKGVMTDFFPEMGKRLINGDTPEGREVMDLLKEKEASGAPKRREKADFAEGFLNEMNRFKKTSR